MELINNGINDDIHEYSILVKQEELDNMYNYLFKDIDIIKSLSGIMIDELLIDRLKLLCVNKLNNDIKIIPGIIYKLTIVNPISDDIVLMISNHKELKEMFYS